MEPQALKREILQSAFGKLLDEAKVPARYHLKVIEALHAKMQEHSKDMETHRQHMARHENQLSVHEQHNQAHERHNQAHEQHNQAHERQIAEWDTTAQHLQSITHLKGEKGDAGEDGKDGIAPTLEEVLQAVLPRIPLPEQGEAGKDADFDEDKVIEKLIKKLQKEKSLDVSHIRNAQTFMKDGIKYKIEELMRGAGGGTGGGGTTILTATGTVDNSNTTFTFTSAPTVVVMNGTVYRNGYGVTISGTTATMDSAPGINGDIYGLGGVSIITVTGTIDNSNVSFTAASTPTLVVVNGAMYRDGHGVTISGTSITLDNAVGTGGDIYAL